MKFFTLAILIVLVVQPNSHAATLIYQFEGILPGPPLGPTIPGVQEGDFFSGSITVDTNTEMMSPEDNVYTWENAITALNITLNGYTLSYNPAADAINTSRFQIDPVFNDASFSIYHSTLSTEVEDWSVDSFILIFVDIGGDNINDAMFPTSGEGINFFHGGFNFISNSTGEESQALIELTSFEVITVPLPGAAILLLSSLGVLGLSRKRKSGDSLPILCV